MRISDWSPDVCSSDLVGTQVLQAVRLELVYQPDVAAFLGQIEQHAAAGCGDRPDRSAQLVAAVAAQAAEQVAGQAGRLQPDQNRLGRIGIDRKSTRLNSSH